MKTVITITVTKYIDQQMPFQERNDKKGSWPEPDLRIEQKWLAEEKKTKKSKKIKKLRPEPDLRSGFPPKNIDQKWLAEKKRAKKS